MANNYGQQINMNNMGQVPQQVAAPLIPPGQGIL